MPVTNLKARTFMMLLIMLFAMFQHESLCLDQNTILRANQSVPFELLSKLCSAVDICDVRATNADVTPNGLLGTDVVSCCTGCSCHPECKERLNCCFPDNDRNRNNEPTSIYKCLYTAVGRLNEELPEFVPAYHTVVKSPTDDCIVTKPVEIMPGLTIHPSCEDGADALPYFPVYSDLKREIYQHIQCALCHGVKDPQYFNTSFACRKLSRYNSNPFVEIFLFTVTGKVPRGCHVMFTFNKPNLISNKRCYERVIEKCETDKALEIPGFDFPDLTITETELLCETGLYSPFPTDFGVYKNVFCFLCGRKSHVKRDLECRFDTLFRSDDMAFTSLIHPGVFLSQQNGYKEETYPKACLDDKGLLGSDGDRCYRIYCPTGRMMDKNGRCIFITNYLTSPVHVRLKLLPVNDQDFRSQTRHVDKITFLDILTRSNPWPEFWSIYKVYIRIDNLECKERAYILVDFVSKRNKPSEFVPQMELMLRVTWTYTLNGTVVTLHQLLREYGLIGSQTMPRMWHIADENFECDSAIWESILVKAWNVLDPPITFNKLFFCNQILLQTKDFTIQPEQENLKSNLTKRVLSKFEFELIQHDYVIQAMVCLEDTILKARVQSRGTRQEKLLAVLASLYLVFNFTY